MKESFLLPFAQHQWQKSGFYYAVSLLSGKYKMLILYILAYKNVMRFNELQRFIGTISYKMLSATLKELEADQLIIRTAYPQIPPKVEYCLSPLGNSLIPILRQLSDWGEKNHL